MPRIRIGTPNGVKLKNRKPLAPARTSSLLTTRFGAVATSVVMPLIRAAKLSGIISWLGGVPVFWQIRITIGMKIATTPVELITAPSAADDHHQQDRAAVSRCCPPAHQPVAEALRDARPHEAVAEHEQRGDEHDVGVAEAGQRLAHADRRR